MKGLALCKLVSVLAPLSQHQFTLMSRWCVLVVQQDQQSDGVVVSCQFHESGCEEDSISMLS